MRELPRKKKEAPAEAVVPEGLPVSGGVDDLANCVMVNPGLVSQMEALGFRSKNPEGMTFKEAMICSQIANAVRGDIKAYRAVMDYADVPKKTPLEAFLDGTSGDVLKVLS